MPTTIWGHVRVVRVCRTAFRRTELFSAGTSETHARLGCLWSCGVGEQRKGSSIFASSRGAQCRPETCSGSSSFLKSQVVLFGQDLRRRHQRGLPVPPRRSRASRRERRRVLPDPTSP